MTEPAAPPETKPGDWKTLIAGALVLMTPVFAITGLGSLMGLGSASARLDWLRTVPEHASLAALAEEPPGATVLVRGHLVGMVDGAVGPAANEQGAGALIIYSQRALRRPGRRFTEDLPQAFPPVMLQLEDGTVTIEPAEEGERPLHDAPHTVADPDGEWERRGFRAGDAVSIQGHWRPAPEGASGPWVIEEATGLSGRSKAEMSADLDRSWRRVSLFGWTCLALAGLGLLALIQRLRGRRTSAEAAA